MTNGYNKNMSEKLNIELTQESGEREELVEKIYQAALQQNEAFKKCSTSEEMKSIIRTMLHEIEELYTVANPEIAAKALTPEIAQKIVAVWDFSGAGTYYEPTKDDAYQNVRWADNADHDRLNYSAFLARKIAELRATGTTLHGSMETHNERIASAKRFMSENGPTIIYNGREDENDAARRIREHNSIVPPEKFDISGTGITKTSHQIRDFKLPENLHQPGKEIVLVSHVEQFPRILRMLQHYKTIPADMTIRLCPIATPKNGREEYALWEGRGLLYYTLLSPNHEAEKKPYPHTIHGLN